jgi:transcriptional regulator with XRE-family HTH domain
LQQSKVRRQREPERRRGSAGPHKIDILVGSRVRMRRNMLGLSQEKLAEKIGLTFQQVQKYERGANRITAGRLHELAQVFDVPVSFFFDETDPVRAPAIPEGFLGEEPKASGSDLLHAPETQELVASFYAITDELSRRRLFELAKALAEPGTDTIARRRSKGRAAPSKAASRASRGRSAQI